MTFDEQGRVFQPKCPDDEKRFQFKATYLNRYPLFAINDTEPESPYRQEIEQLCREYQQHIHDVEQNLEKGESIPRGKIDSLIELIRTLNKRQRETATVRGINESHFDRLLDLPQSEWEHVTAPTDEMGESPRHGDALLALAKHLSSDDLREIALDHFIALHRNNRGVKYGRSAEEYRMAFDRYTTSTYSVEENYLYALISTLNEGQRLDGSFHFLIPLLLDEGFRNAYPDESKRIAELYFNALCNNLSKIRRSYERAYYDAIENLSHAYGFETPWRKMERLNLAEARKILRDLLSYDNQKLASYTPIIKEGSSSASENPQPYSDNWGSILSHDTRYYHEDNQDLKEEHLRDIEFLKTKLKGDVLVDLGSGGGRVSAIYSFADVKTDIGVEKFHSGRGPLDATEPEFACSYPRSGGGETFHISVRDDMLDFVARVKNDSSLFMLNGIDYSILPNPEYRMALAEEIIRATKEGGIVFGLGHLGWIEDYFSKLKGEFKMSKQRLPYFKMMSGGNFCLFVKERVQESNSQTIAIDDKR